MTPASATLTLKLSIKWQASKRNYSPNSCLYNALRDIFSSYSFEDNDVLTVIANSKRYIDMLRKRFISAIPRKREFDINTGDNKSIVMFWRLQARVLIFDRFAYFWRKGYQRRSLGKSHHNGDYLKTSNAKKLSAALGLPVHCSTTFSHCLFLSNQRSDCSSQGFFVGSFYARITQNA